MVLAVWPKRKSNREGYLPEFRRAGGELGIVAEEDHDLYVDT